MSASGFACCVPVRRTCFSLVKPGFAFGRSRKSACSSASACADVTRTLVGLARGEKGTIANVTGDDAIALRILEMGLTDGEEVTFLGTAPLGDPLEFSVRGYRISLRFTEAERVQLTAVGPAA